jgi:hypothetical protein
MTAKSAPSPPRTVTVFWLKNTGRGRCFRRVTQPPHIAGPLAKIRSYSTEIEMIILEYYKL